MNRKATYKRVEKVLLEGKLGASQDSIQLLKKDLEEVLSKYMNISDMYVHFDRLDNNNYRLKLVAEVYNVKAPNVI